MRASDTIPTGKPLAARRLAGDFRRALLTCGIAVAFGIVVAAIAIALQPPASVEKSRATSEANLSTGSMLFVAPTGNQCRKSTIDNSTWRIRNNGLVDCDEALAKAANSGTDARSPVSRLELIRQGFRGAP